MGTLLGLGRLRNALLLRGAAIWVGLRVMAAWAGIGDPTVAQELFILALVGGLVVWDARRRNEHVWLANLGVSVWPMAVLGACGALPLELLVP
ncbi:MAG: hypothetical protein KJO11_11600 [Gemmatimonadetes bacterium]|nr:hypothetical protein [Gemmatimonadota bacterium]MBT8402395.1 hypothetical protein [Gemmatimonadota bacterium]NNF38046.1 hypothetical protein [Gemmatimonadota bacterium]NNK62977.1 hypothetical protein [Gemmatimonadota bacterium]